MDKNAELLNYVYQNAQMGIETIGQICEMLKEDEFKKLLKDQHKEYKDLGGRAKLLLSENGYDEKSIGEFAKLSSYVMINMQTIRDKSNSHIADMLIKGSNMGIVEGTKRLHEYEDSCKEEAVSLMKELVKVEESNLENLKKYL